MAKTAISGREVKDNALTGDDILEESLLCEKIPFSDPSITANNLKAAVVEAKGVWGKNFSHTTKTTSQSTSLQALQTYHSVVLSNLVVGAKYRVGVDYTALGDNSASGYYAALTRDTTVLRQTFKMPYYQKQSADMSDGFFTYFIATATSHTIKFQFSSQYTWAQITMQQCALEVWRVS